MSHPDFDQLVACLFSALRLPREAMTSKHAGYTIRIGQSKLLIDLIGLQ